MCATWRKEKSHGLTTSERTTLSTMPLITSFARRALTDKNLPLADIAKDETAELFNHMIVMIYLMIGKLPSTGRIG